MEKTKYYVNIATHVISQIQSDENNHFVIFATGEEVFQLRQLLTEMHDSDMDAFWRAHVPIVSYHNDQPNDSYDHELLSAFQLIHDLGDERTKEHIESMGILE